MWIAARRRTEVNGRSARRLEELSTRGGAEAELTRRRACSSARTKSAFLRVTAHPRRFGRRSAARGAASRRASA